MKSETVKAIFTNLLFVIGVILMVIGFIRGITTGVNLLVFDQYPLNQYEETRCSLDLGPYPVKSPDEPDTGISAQEQLERQATCEQALIRARQTTQVNDVTYSIGFFTSGLLIALTFKRFIFTPQA